MTILACNEALHPDLLDRALLYQTSSFSHSLHPLRTFVAVTSDVDYGGGRGAVNISHVINRS
ncbi:hypothetical protein ACUXK4_005094 [Methylorubrum extorquens]